jgi:hypothetical protein
MEKLQFDLRKTDSETLRFHVVFSLPVVIGIQMIDNLIIKGALFPPPK